MSFRVPESDSDEKDRQPFSYWNNRPTTSNLYPQVGRNPPSVFSRPLSTLETTSGSASFHSIENQDELDLTDEPTLHYELKPETEIQHLELESTNDMVGPGGPSNPQNPAMDVDHEGKSYLKKPEPFDGNQ